MRWIIVTTKLYLKSRILELFTEDKNLKKFSTVIIYYNNEEVGKHLPLAPNVLGVFRCSSLIHKKGVITMDNISKELSWLAEELNISFSEAADLGVDECVRLARVPSNKNPFDIAFRG